MAWCEERITAHAKADAKARVAMQLSGIGPIGASAVVASVGEFEQFDDARQFGSWMGLVPSQNSSGGKARLGGVHKRGDAYLRTLLVQGARSAVQSAHRRDDRVSRWVYALRERRGWQKAAVALANKNARILWALLSKGECYDPEHVPAVPPGKCSTKASRPASDKSASAAG